MLSRDTFLFLRLRRGNRAVFEAVIAAHYASVYRQQYLLCLNRDLAADLTQETFVEAWRSLPGFHVRADVRTWLHRIAVRVWQRKATGANLPILEPDVGEQTSDPSAGPEALVLRGMETDRILCALEKLPPDVRAVIVLHYAQNGSLREVAALLDLPVGTVKSRLNAGLRQLRRSTLFLEEL